MMFHTKLALGDVSCFESQTVEPNVNKSNVHVLLLWKTILCFSWRELVARRSILIYLLMLSNIYQTRAHVI